MPQSKPIAVSPLALYIADADSLPNPARLVFEASGRIVLRYWTAAQWDATAEAHRPGTAIELPEGAWVDLAPG